MNHESQNWFTSDEWRSKGIPNEQIEIDINDKQVDFYNFNNKELTSEHIEKAQNAFDEISRRFPWVLEKIRWILIKDSQDKSLSGDEKDYPLNGLAKENWKALIIMPRALDLKEEHRVGKVNNFEGTLVHEISHFITDDFITEWQKNFKWAPFDRKKWDAIDLEDGTIQNINKETGEIASGSFNYPVNPEECVTAYARKDTEEDICDSIVSYIYNPEKLKQASFKKYEIIKSIEKANRVSINTIKREGSDVVLPEIKPQTIKIYIKE